ncbi:DUF5977 domain-containing protein [Pedobacter aquatilis]|uniref:DUF5977 domain-containing protein n=1 Tax=Pedobacter aquatilis TaxID=351343 RepID=UPI0025B4B6DD|nr:DUF5977 domain-containing protein [Pedobacter aquatilis]MDN3588035.1 DUF5977 domain-containing protein [Pedobacter aquatilis]
MKVKNYWICLVAWAAISIQSSYAQTALPKVIPPSPETQALINLPQYNLGMANGQPNISIPIYTIQSGSLSLPISISYNSQGRKISDLTGPVGIGWSLNCGGVIARTVYGKPEGSKPFPETIPLAQNLNNQSNFDFLAATYYDNSNTVGSYDTEFDVYTFQSGSKSGKFVYSSDGLDVHFFPFSTVKVQRTNSFPNQITDDNGDNYFYDFVETEAFSKNGASFGSQITTAAYLTKMSSAYGDEINLSYLRFGKEVSQQIESKTLFDNSVPAGSVPNTITQTDNLVTDLKLTRVSQIDFKNGKLVFEFLNANDQIRFIRLYNHSNQLLKSFEFIYSFLDNSNYVHSINSNPSYPNKGYNYKLDAIKITDANGTEVQRYAFEYNPSENFYVQSRDMWGFRNGSLQTNLMPDYNTDYNGGTLNVGNGANRNPNPVYAKMGTLKKITYPTGGSTEFFYEGNRIQGPNNSVIDGPGLRIHEIRNSISGSVTDSKVYEYPSFGQLAVYPMTNYLYMSTESRTFPLYKLETGGFGNDIYKSYRSRTFSSEITPDLHFLLNQPIFYNLVTEYTNGDQQQGKTVFSYEGSYYGNPSLSHPKSFNMTGIPPFTGYYNNIQQSTYARNYYLPSLALNNSPRLSSMSVYKYNPDSPGSYELVKGTNYQYALKPGPALLGLKLFKYLDFPQDMGSSLYYQDKAAKQDFFPVYEFVNYEIPTGNFELSSTTETQDGITSQKVITYNEKHLEQSESVTNSDGKSYRTELFYPFDFTSNPTLVSLVSSNRIGSPVERKIFNINTNTWIAGNRTLFQDFGSGVTEPASLESYSPSKGYESRTSFQHYNNFGQIQSLSKTGGSKIVYVYAYKGAYPIIEVSNAEYSSIESILGGAVQIAAIRESAPEKSVVDNLAGLLKSALPDAFITSHTYTPMIGMTSQTDARGMTTYYEYDSFQRLKYIKDRNGDIVKSYCYNFAGQQVDCGTESGPQPVTYYSAAQSGSFTKNDCGMNGTGATVTYTIAAGSYTSIVSQSDADNQALSALNSGGQAYANANAGCSYVYHSAAQSGSFTKNDCGVNGTGATVTYTIAAGSYTSGLSQADADNQALSALNSGGQAYANVNAGCSYIYYSAAQSGIFTKNDCGVNGTGATVTYTIAAGSYTSGVSQADADNQALSALNSGGQAYANANAGCSYIYYSAAQSGSFTKNDCGVNGTGATVAYTIAAGSYTSNVSQADADNQALAALNSGGQGYANANASCSYIYYSAAQGGSFTKNDCGVNGTGGTVTYTIAAGSYTSGMSQVDADNQALSALNSGGQGYANANAGCSYMYYSNLQSGTFTRNNCGANGTGGSVTYSIPAGSYTSSVSQADADNQALSALNAGGQGYANVNAGCSYLYQSNAQSGNFTRSNCGVNGTGGTVTYTVVAGSFTSAISQTDADSKALAALNAEGPGYANLNAGCSYIYYSVAQSGNFSRTNCAPGGTPGSVNYSIPAGSYTSTVSQEDANTQAANALFAGGPAYANANAGCTFYNVAIGGEYQKTDCDEGGVGSFVPYSIAAGTYSSTISQADADNQAGDALHVQGPANARANGTCTYYNNEQRANFTRDCGPGGVGSTVSYVINAGTYTSNISIADANAKALAAVYAGGQDYAQANGTCTYSNAAQSADFTRNNCPSGALSGSITYTIAAGSYTSTISQEHADLQAGNALLSGGQSYANMHATCTFYNSAQSRAIAKNDCGSGGPSTPVTYTVAAGTYSSTSSQAAADQLAINDIDANGQLYANAHGTCAVEFTLDVVQHTYSVGENINIYFQYTGGDTVNYELIVTNPDGSSTSFAPRRRNLFQTTTMQSGQYLAMGRTISSSGVESPWLPVYFSVN